MVVVMVLLQLQQHWLFFEKQTFRFSGRSTGACHVNAVEVDGQAVFIVEPPVARLNGTRGLEVWSLERKAFFLKFLYLFIIAYWTERTID